MMDDDGRIPTILVEEFRKTDDIKRATGLSTTSVRFTMLGGTDITTLLPTTALTPLTCRVEEFTCTGTLQCIPEQRRCDSIPDCRDRSDEDNCPRRCDPNREIECGDGTCVAGDRRCDGFSDCRDSRDEQGCASLMTIQVTPSRTSVDEGGSVELRCSVSCPRAIRDCTVEWRFRSVSGSLPTNVRAAGDTLQIFSARRDMRGQYFCFVKGYPSTSDTATVIVNPVQPARCKTDEYTCGNGRCVPRDALCNSRDDCGDNSDENNCIPKDDQCEPPEFRCRNQKCVQKFWRCDGDDDCRDGSDELIEYCPVKPAGSPCDRYSESCSDGRQCIPRAYLCDGQFDCQDRSDEIGCTDPRVTQPPPPTLTVTVGGTIRVTCRAVGKPTPIISWRLNWGNIPTGARVTETSVDGYGVLVIRNARVTDSGAYTCEAINNQNAKFAQPDIIVTVIPGGVNCPQGQFNMNARVLSDCIDCYCFGITDQCTSSGWFIEQLPVSGASIDLVSQTGTSILPVIHVYDAASRETSVPFYSSDAPSGVLYWRLPSNDFRGNQLKSYGGFLRYTTKYEDGDRVAFATPKEVIISGSRDRKVYCTQRDAVFTSGSWTTVEIELVEANCIIVRKGGGDVPILEEAPATRDDLMMVLQDVESVLIRATLDRAQGSVTIKDVTIEKAELTSRSNIAANKVETCQCPQGYQGMSCEDCSPGYSRTKASTRYPLGKCVIDPGQPDNCNPIGTARRTADGRCECLELTTGRYCDQCRSQSFFLNDNSLNGCVECFCMGITKSCSSSPYSRNVVRAETRTTRGWAVTEEDGENLIDNVLTVSNGDLEANLTAYGTGVYYMKLPQEFSGNQLAAYGGTLRFKLRFVTPNIQSVTDSPDLVLGSENIQLYADYSTRFQDANQREIDVAVPIFEKYWSRADGVQATHEHLLMALSDVDYILVKLSAVDLARTAVLSDISLDVADSNAPRSNPRADAVEQCQCPVEYEGESCERCSDGYKRAPGLYLGVCVRSLCQCNGHTDECDERRGICINCQHGTDGQFCDECDTGYVRNLNDQSRYECVRPDQIAVIDQPIITVTVYGRAELICRAFEKDLPVRSIIWRRVDNRPLNRAASQRDGRLIIPRVERTDGGDYVCVVTTTGNVQGQGRATIIITTTTPTCPTGYINPPRCDQCDRGYYKDQSGRCRRSTAGLRVNLSPSNSELTEGESVTLVCDITSPANDYVIMWETPGSVDGRSGIAGDSSQSSRMTSLRVGPVRVEDAGTYRCTARRTNGEIAYDEATVVVRRRVVVVEPRFTLQPSGPQSLTVGDQLVLRCSAVDALRRPLRVQWMKDGRPLADVGEATLYINSVTASDRGTYMCTVTIDNQFFTSTIIVMVRQNRLPVTVPPPQMTVRIEPSKLLVVEGQNGRLKCVVIGDARDVEWSRSNGQLNPSFTTSTDRIANDTLIINGMRRTDRDYYYCKARGNDLVTSVQSSPVIVDIQQDTGRPEVNPPVLPTETEAYVGDTVRMECRASGRQAVDRIGWSRDGVVFDNRFDVTGGVLILRDAKLQDSGAYTCTVTYSSGQRAQGSTRLTVRERVRGRVPRITIVEPISGSTLLDLSVGDTGNFRCTSDDPRARYVWSRSDNSPMTRNVVDQRNGILMIGRVTEADAGTYVCVATNAAGSSRAEAYVRVSPRTGPTDNSRPTISDLPQRVTAEVGGIAELTCSVNSRTRDVPQVYWKNSRGQQLTEKQDYTARLRFDPVRFSQRGEYTCIAEIPGASSSSSTFLDVQGRDQNWEQNPLTVTKQIGEAAELECQPTGQTPTRTTWERVGTDELPLGADRAGSKLLFTRLRLSDAGTYTCTAESSNGNSVLYVDLIVEGPPATPVVSADGTTLGPNGVKTYNVGEKVTLICLADGAPRPKYEWSRMLAQGGFQKIENDANIQVMSGDMSSEIIIYEVRPSDAGYYNCTAYNDYGKREVFSRVAVNSANVAPTDVIVSGSGEGSMRNLYKPGQTAILRCIASSSTPVTYAWTFSGGEMGDNVVISNAVLRINNLSSDNQGTYYCTVSNEGGDASPVAAQVYVSGVPSAPKPLVGSTSREVGQTVRLTCPLPSGADRVEWARQDRSAISQSSRTLNQGQILEIYDLDESDFGVYLCTAVNSVGSSVPASISLKGERSSVGPELTVTEVNEGDIVVLECLKPADAVRILWTREENKSLPPQSQYNDTELRIPNIRSEDAGTYYCTAYFNTGDSVRSRESVIAVTQQTGGGGVQLNTPRTAGNTQQTLNIGDSTILTCSYPDAEDVELTWSRLNDNLPRTSYTSGDNLNIENVQPEDAGTYYCIARRGVVESRPLEYTVVVVGATKEPIELPAPTIDVSGEMTEGSTVNLNCMSEVNGVAYTWSRNGSVLPKGSASSGPYLRLYDLQPSSAGIYVCTIKNGQGMNSASQEILVVEDATPLTADIEAYGTKVSDGVYAVGRVLELECVANDEAATVSWEYVPDEAYVQGRTLVFPSLVEEHGGDYRCTASLEAQQAIAEFSFVVSQDN